MIRQHFQYKSRFNIYKLKIQIFGHQTYNFCLVSQSAGITFASTKSTIRLGDKSPFVK